MSRALDDAERCEILESAASRISDDVVAAHVREYATVQRDGSVYLAEVWAEDDDALTARIRAALGQPRPSGYMSEERGWDVPIR